MTQSDTPLADLKPVNVAGSPPAREKSPDAVPKPKNAAPATATNIRYKIVKVGETDGTTVTVKGPIKQESMSMEHYALFSSLTNALALTTSSSSTSKVTTTTITTNKLPDPAQQTSASVAQKSERKVLATSLPAKSPNPVATPAKIESESSAKTAEQSTSASHQGSFVTATDHESNILASTSKVSKRWMVIQTPTAATMTMTVTTSTVTPIILDLIVKNLAKKLIQTPMTQGEIPNKLTPAKPQ